jgi:hypothetical protein
VLQEKGEHAIEFACVPQIPDIMISTILKIAQGIETKALVKLFEYEN